ncbi:MAG TPA: cupin domain-containing protein [Acidobacteriaceae bacterium]
MPNRRAFLGASAAALPLIAGFASAEQGHLPSVVIDPATAKLTHESYGDRRIYFDGSTGQLRALTVGCLVLKAGMAPHPPHQHPEEEIMLVTEGAGEITVEAKAYPVGPGSMMYCSGQRMHGITAGPHGLTFYFYKWGT